MGFFEFRNEIEEINLGNIFAELYNSKNLDRNKPENWDRNKAYIEKIKKQIKQDKNAFEQETKEK